MKHRDAIVLETKVLKYEPGDTIVASAPVPLSQEEACRIHARLKESFPGANLVLTDASMTLERAERVRLWEAP